MPDVPDEIIPVGSVVSGLTWWNTPDKYDAPSRFDSLERARDYDRSGYITVELRLQTPDARSVRVVGAVSSADDFVRSSPRQDEGVLPAMLAVVIDLVRRDRSLDRHDDDHGSMQSRIEDAYAEIIFRHPAGGHFVLLPLTTHSMQR